MKSDRVEAEESAVAGTACASVETRFHHVGVAVRNMERALAYYTGVLGMKLVSGPVDVPSQNVRVCFLACGPARIELVEGLSAGSPVERLVSESGGGPYHLCFQVKDLDAVVRRLRRERFFLLTRFEARAGASMRFAFMLTPDRQLMEFCEECA